MSAWRPIETAPDGGEFLVWIPDTELAWPGYRTGDKFYSNAHGQLNLPKSKDNRWPTIATHWMPLPEPPK